MTNQNSLIDNIEQELNNKNPEIIWLEEVDFKRAKHLSNSFDSENSTKWQTYQNFLTLVGIKGWLKQRKPQATILHQNCQSIDNILTNLKLGEFQLCIITLDQLFGTVVNLPKQVVKHPNLAAHFYLVVEVIEEQQHLVIHGFLRYDQLKQTLKKNNSKLDEDRSYKIPVSWVNSDLDRLLIYLRFLKPNAILLPISIPEKIGITNLNNWFNNIVEEGWETWDTLERLITPSQLNLVRVRSRSCRSGSSFESEPLRERIKLLKGKNPTLKEPISLVLVTSIKPTDSSEIEVISSLQALDDLSNTTEDLQILLLNEKEEIIGETKAKNAEEIEMTLTAEKGDKFTLKFMAGDISFTEKFLL